MTSATEELRRLLDERGVEWRESVNVANCVFTIYESPTFGEVAAMDNDGTLYFHELNGIDVTPEQAIAATLGESDESCYLMCDRKKFPVELDCGFVGIMPIAITVAGFRYLLEVPDGE